jgi:hypothetical protein
VQWTGREARGGGNDVCELSDPLVPEGDAAGEVDNNTLDVTSSASSIEEVFTIQKNAGTTQHVCFFIEAADNARDNEGNLEPNTSDQSAHTDITWN